MSSGDHMLRDRTLIETHLKLSAAYWRQGDREAADASSSARCRCSSERLASGADDGATKYYVAAIHGLRGDAARAARYLRRPWRSCPGLNRARARVDPDFDPVRAVPEIAAILAG